MPVREVLLDIDNEVWFPFLYKVRSSKLELGSIYELVTFQTGKYKCLYSPIWACSSNSASMSMAAFKVVGPDLVNPSYAVVGR